MFSAVANSCHFIFVQSDIPLTSRRDWEKCELDIAIELEFALFFSLPTG